MTEPTNSRWKWYLGVVLLAYSLVALGLAATMPFLFSPAVAAALATALVVSGEVTFWGGAAILGEPFIRAMKERVKGWLTPAVAPKPSHAGNETVVRTVHRRGDSSRYHTLRMAAPDIDM
jgi:hypothetical protein